MLKTIHPFSHMSIQRMQDTIRNAHVRIRDTTSKVTKIVKDYKACQITNTVGSEKNSGYRLCGRRTRAYWEIDFMEVKPKKKIGYTYLCS